VLNKTNTCLEKGGLQRCDNAELMALLNRTKRRTDPLACLEKKILGIIFR